MNLKNLPSWAEYDKKKRIIIVKPDVVYPMYLKELGYDNKKTTQFMLECARRCFTQDLITLIGPGIHLRIAKDEKYKLTEYPAGEPINWRTEYKRLLSARNKQN